MLIALSPDLVALVTDDIVDKDAFEQLLQIGFSTPAFEQVSLAKTSREWTLQLFWKVCPYLWSYGLYLWIGGYFQYL